MKCQKCNTKCGGNVCPSCGRVPNATNPTKVRTYEETERLWRNLLFCDRIVQNHRISGPVIWFLSVWIGIIQLQYGFVGFTCWTIGINIMLTTYVCMRKYLPKHGALIFFGLFFGALLGTIVGYGFVQSFMNLPVVGNLLGVLCLLCTLLPPVILFRYRKSLIKKLQDTVHNQNHFDLFAARLVHNQIKKQVRNEEIPVLYMRQGFYDQVEMNYIGRMNEIFERHAQSNEN